MGLAHKKNTSIPLLGVLVFLFTFSPIYNYALVLGDLKNKDKNFYKLLENTKGYNEKVQYNLEIKNYEKTLQDNSADSVQIFKELAFLYSKINNPELVSFYTEKYIKASLDVSFINHSHFDQIRDSGFYKDLTNTYQKKICFWSIFCFYVAFIGFFISIVLNFKKRSDKISNLLMSAFVLIHSFFIIHVGLYSSNYEYYLPHILYMSTLFSFLYGPLIYFYFRRITIMYRFRLSNLWHFTPTVLLVILLFPIYNLPAEEKLRIIINQERPYMILISISKLISLLIYGILVMKMYFQSIKNNKHLSRVVSSWQRNIVIFCSIYILSYGTYAVLIIKSIFSGFLFYLQITAMAILVLYVGYTAFVQPSIFERLRIIKDRLQPELGKYKKSGLTESLSLELKEKLLYLLDEEKIYKRNDITLQKLAEFLDTTRHNASQIINEHFNLNFFELINRYRIEEAKELLKREKNKSFNIIDVAYEVGFNNKVTFNKSFKKYNQITPSEYLKSLVA